MRSVVSILALAALAGAAQAQFYQSTVGIGSPTQTIVFNEFGVAAQTVVTNQYATLGVTFFNTWQSPQGGGFPNIDNDNLGNFGGGTFNFGPFNIFFNTDVNAASFSMVTNQGTTSFEAWNNGNFVFASGPIGTDTTSSNNFYGFTGIVFDEIRVDPTNTGNSAMLMDNLSYSKIPSPGSLALLGLGGLAAARRRR